MEGGRGVGGESRDGEAEREEEVCALFEWWVERSTGGEWWRAWEGRAGEGRWVAHLISVASARHVE